MGSHRFSSGISPQWAHMNQIIVLYRISIASEISPEWDIPLRLDVPLHMKRPQQGNISEVLQVVVLQRNALKSAAFFTGSGYVDSLQSFFFFTTVPAIICLSKTILLQSKAVVKVRKASRMARGNVAEG